MPYETERNEMAKITSGYEGHTHIYVCCTYTIYHSVWFKIMDEELYLLQKGFI